MEKVRVVKPEVAVMVAVCADVTAAMFAVNPADLPRLTVTDEGTVTAGLLLESWTLTCFPFPFPFRLTEHWSVPEVV
jgi:hypothetical protein